MGGIIFVIGSANFDKFRKSILIVKGVVDMQNTFYFFSNFFFTLGEKAIRTTILT